MKAARRKSGERTRLRRRSLDIEAWQRRHSLIPKALLGGSTRIERAYATASAASANSRRAVEREDNTPGHHHHAGDAIK